MAFVRNPVVYVPDLTNGRPIVDGKVYILTAGTVPPMHDSAIDPLDLVTVSYYNEADNLVEQPQPLYTSKGGCLYGNYPDAARQFIISPQAYVFAVYNSIGQLEYSTETTASDYVEIDALAAANSTVLVGGEAAGKVGDVVGYFDIGADSRLQSGLLTVGSEVLSGATLRDAVVVGRNVVGGTNCHDFAARTIISGVTDSGTFGVFDSTVELQGGHAHDHVYAYQDRNKYTGTGTVNNIAGFYSQPTLTGAGTITRRSGVYIRDYLDPSGTSNVTINTGIYIESLVKGANKFALVSVGDVPSYHGGRFSVGFPTSSPATTEGFAYVGVSTSGTSQIGINSRGGASSSATFQYSAFAASPALSPGVYTTQETHGLVVRNASVGSGATLTKQYGVSVDDLTAASQNYAFRTKVTAGTNKWNMYQEGNANNWISGNSYHGLTATVPTARSHYAAQTATAGTAPIKLTAGTVMSTPETGAFEFDGTNLYFTVGGVRKTVTLV